MTTLTAPSDLRLPSPRRSKLAWAAADSLAVARRNIIGMTRRPQVLAFATIQPVLFVLLFRYVFGSSIHTPGVSYTDYLMAGIFVQTVMFGAQNTAVGMAEDLRNGLFERFRSLVMARSAVLAGRVLADALVNMLGIALMLGVGYLVGFRLHTNAAALAAAASVLLLFGFAISWVTALLGLAAKSAEGAAAASLPLTVLLAFPSSAFLLTSNMPGPLRAYADHQPLTATVNTIRPLLLGGPTASHAVAAIIWCLGIVAVFAPSRCSGTVGPSELPRGRLTAAPDRLGGAVQTAAVDASDRDAVDAFFADAGLAVDHLVLSFSTGRAGGPFRNLAMGDLAAAVSGNLVAYLPVRRPRFPGCGPMDQLRVAGPGMPRSG